MSQISELKTDYFVYNGTRFVFIDGLFCKIIAQCYDALQQQLSFPDYFGRNLDALEEMLSDLEWIEEERIKIIIANGEGILSEDPKKRKIFLDILNSSENEKLEVIYLGKK